ncbi:MAG: hypothetical protein ACLTZT_09825 [Butyricimonas faecalis]
MFYRQFRVRNNTKLTTATHIHPNTNGLDHPFVFVLDVTSDNLYRIRAKIWQT